ncbi:hypothetical protein [Listeria booriae]|uniref:hypothetical protein n=1 Tax=Listeria booriae TaxID=1552123 RepID=UPI0016287740|nr:hypothetical protein [Listeria booriae]MBC2080851.1 hypothetical protein [Listeria booriae]MBC2324642.1 hypothetical protein [Listeria booriae]
MTINNESKKPENWGGLLPALLLDGGRYVHVYRIKVVHGFRCSELEEVIYVAPTARDKYGNQLLISCQ